MIHTIHSRTNSFSLYNKSNMESKSNISKNRFYYCAIVFLLIQIIKPTYGTITISESSNQYRSQPAAFGMYFVEGREYLARLQSLVWYDPFLCDMNHVEENGKHIVVPDDGLPVAILAQQGQCTFETKARIAQQLNPAVKYLIVYNNVPNDENLVTMSAEDPSGIYAGALFISYISGMDLQMQIDESDDVNATGFKQGVRIYLDSYTDTYDLGWISWIFVVLTCLFSMFLCLSTGYIRANQGNVRVIIVNGTRQYEELLNDDDLSYLSDYEYQDAVHNFEKLSADIEPDALSTTEKTIGEDTDDKTVKSQFSFDLYSSCSICLEDFVIGEKLIKLPCTHYFHPDCIKPWLTERQPTCPLCKANVKSDINSKRRRLNTPDGESYHSDDENQTLFQNDRCAVHCRTCLQYTCPCLYGLGGVIEEEDINNITSQNGADEIDVEEGGDTRGTSVDTIHTPLLEGQYDSY